MSKEKKVKLGKHGVETTQIGFNIVGSLKSKKLTEGVSSTGKQKKTITLGVETSPNNIVYIDFGGYEREFAYFYSQDSGTEKVEWSKRKQFSKSGYNKIGITYAVDEGNNITDFDFDSVDGINEVYQEGDIVRVIGELEFSSYEGKNYVKTIGKKLYFSNADMKKEGYVEENRFEGKVVVVNSESDKNEDGVPFLLVNSKIITYGGVENFDFKILNANLAKNFKKLKPYTTIEIEGNLKNEVIIKEITEDDGWGVSKKVEKSIKKDFIVYYANPNSLDKDTFTEEILNKANESKEIEKKFDGDEWGNSNKSKKDDTDDDSFPF